MELLIPGLRGVSDNMLLKLPRQPFASRRVVNVERRQPRTEILTGDQIAAPESHRAEKLFAFNGNKRQR